MVLHVQRLKILASKLSHAIKRNNYDGVSSALKFVFSSIIRMCKINLIVQNQTRSDGRILDLTARLPLDPALWHLFY